MKLSIGKIAKMLFLLIIAQIKLKQAVFLSFYNREA